MPILSFLCATLNDNRLFNAINSIIYSSIDPRLVEILITEGGSENLDIRELSATTNFSLYYSVKPDSGPYDAMNSLILASSAKYCMILNSDDVIIEEGMLRILTCLEDNRPDIVFADVTIVNHSGMENSFNSRLIPYLARHIHPIIGMPVPHSGFICKTSILKQHLFCLPVGLEADYTNMLDILCSQKFNIINCSSIPVVKFSATGLSSKRRFFSSSNPHIGEIRALTNASIDIRLKALGILIRIIKLFLLLPVKALSSVQ